MEPPTRGCRTSRRKISVMATLAVVSVAVGASLALTSPALADTTTRFKAVFHEEFEGASPSTACPTGGADPCGVGRVIGFGAATERWVAGVEEDEGSCVRITDAVTTITLRDGSGTLQINEDEVVCWPGNSTNSPGNVVHSFGNPFYLNGTWEIVSGSGTGVFAGASGTGTVTNYSGGDVIAIQYSGSIQLP